MIGAERDLPKIFNTHAESSSLLQILEPPISIVTEKKSHMKEFVAQLRLACITSEQHLPEITVTTHLSNTFMQIW